MDQQSLTSFIDERRYSYIINDNPDKDQFPLWYQCEKEEVILNPGEKLFIPAGWFHFVFSEGEGLNSAINFWYQTSYGESEEEDKKPKKEYHDINPDLKDVLGDAPIKFTKAKGKVFPPTQMIHRFPHGYMDYYALTYDEFLESKNPKFYAVQQPVTNCNHLAPSHETPVTAVNLWLNFGQGSRSLPHYDMQDNWLCQLSGRKRVILIPQKYRSMLYLRNPYELPFLNDVHTYYTHSLTHPFVMRKPSLTEIECAIIKEKDEISTSDLLFSHLNKIIIHEGVNFIKAFQSMQLVVSPPENIIKFKVEKVKEVKRDVLDIDDSMYTAVWAVEKSIIFIGIKEHKLNPGDLIIFPTQLSNTWHAEPGSFIIYPVYKD